MSVSSCCWLPVCIVLLLWSAAPARAQCGADASSCLSCHEVQHQRSILSDGKPWHVDHGFGDLCARCHGGRPGAADKEGAHQGRVDPLSNPAGICGACHGTGAAAYADRYARLRVPPPKAPKQESEPGSGRGSGVRWSNIALAIAVVLLGAGGVLFIRSNERRRRRYGVPSRALRFSAYGTGAALGGVVAISMAVFGHPLGASGAFLNLAGSLARRIAPGAIYFRDLMPAGMTWQVWVVLGLFAGALLGAVTRHEFVLCSLPAREWTSAFGPSRAKRWMIAFLSAALIEFAAGIAGGCTSGLAISGGVVMAPGAFLFMGAMFATGIPTARIVFRKSSPTQESP